VKTRVMELGKEAHVKTSRHTVLSQLFEILWTMKMDTSVDKARERTSPLTSNIVAYDLSALDIKRECGGLRLTRLL
jgi:hypothetical protein